MAEAAAAAGHEMEGAHGLSEASREEIMDEVFANLKFWEPDRTAIYSHGRAVRHGFRALEMRAESLRAAGAEPGAMALAAAVR
eukprot:3982784-Heterocapsa_arctica.AAC.1